MNIRGSIFRPGQKVQVVEPEYSHSHSMGAVVTVLHDRGGLVTVNWNGREISWFRWRLKALGSLPNYGQEEE